MPRSWSRDLGWEKFIWRTGAAIALALIGLALALDVRGGNLDAGGIALALLAAVGLAVVIAVSSRMFGGGDARPLTFYMAAGACALLLVIGAGSGELRCRKPQADGSPSPHRRWFTALR